MRAAAHLGILGGFTVAPVMTMAGVGGLLFPFWSLLHSVAVALVLLGIAWPLLALVAAHYRRAGVVVAAGGEPGGERTRAARGFGAYLRHLRMSRRLSIEALVERLARFGYEVTPDTYAGFEAGASLPKDGQTFLNAVSASLKLSRPERKVLAREFGRQILIEAMGEELTKQCLPETSEEE